ncbi:hypothetical protein CTI12_AA121570 [Artemisia annua]|uniref:Uncharacterized protein n=1 Tax=Artemisia annua TaxID=35608 RepID=A0A2U1PRI2_ARTAN|nr:hypothetical protein CTI12_AA121570 [Artemisia annua]
MKNNRARYQNNREIHYERRKEKKFPKESSTVYFFYDHVPTNGSTSESAGDVGSRDVKVRRYVVDKI